jgi:iron complex outermembrane receptor protein
MGPLTTRARSNPKLHGPRKPTPTMSRKSCLPVRLLQSAASLLSLSLLFLVLAPALSAQAVATGRVTGTVTSHATGNALQGARVSLPASGQSTLTDGAGHFEFASVPAGQVDVVASYSGFEESTAKVTVVGGTAADATLVLHSTDVVALDKYTVSSVKEGQALSITEQRNAANAKTVVALDEWGVLPTENVGELFTRLPGVSYTVDEDNLINNITIRGMVSPNGQSFTRLNVDGMSATGVGGNGRTATLHSFSASGFEQIELISAQTPDKRADSIGGQINLKTRSPLAMQGRRRIDYDLSGTLTPPAKERIDALKDHPHSYAASLGYTEVFDVFGGRRNLGVQLNLAHQMVVKQFDFDFDQYPLVTDVTQSYFRDYDKASGINHRFLDAVNLRLDYRFDEHTTVSYRLIYNEGDEPFFHYTHINPFFSTNGTIFDAVTNPSGGIMPGSNTTRTEIRATGNAQMLLTPRRFSFVSNNATNSLFFTHQFGRLKIDHAWRYSKVHADSNAGVNQEGGQLTLRTKNPIGFILDNSNLNGRVFTQTQPSLATDSVYDPASYQAFVVTAANTTTAPVAQTSDRFDQRSTFLDTQEKSGNVNFTYEMPTSMPITLKAGWDGINHVNDNRQINPRRWYLQNGVTLTGLPLMAETEFEKNNGGRLPVFDPHDVVRTLNNSALWYEDVYFNAVQKLTSKRYMDETVNAEYIQAEVRPIRRLLLLGGFRWEHENLKTATYVNKATTNTGYVTTLQESDPYKRAAANALLQTTHATYTNLFPSIHGVYDITPNLKARASWSTSYGRPDLIQLVPAASVSDTAQTVTIGNPLLKPQMARQIEFKLEYYFPNNGVVSVGVFRKRITDVLSGNNFTSGTVPQGNDNGFDGLYGGYTIISARNLGAETMKGVEFDYNQRLTFLPGELKGLALRANYTLIAADADFTFAATQTSPVHRTTYQIAGTAPRAGNLGLTYNRGKFGANFDVNYTGAFPFAVISTLNINTPQFAQLISYRKSVTTTNLSFDYRVTPNATVYFAINNVGAKGYDRYLQTTDRPREHIITPRSLQLGITGRF